MTATVAATVEHVVAGNVAVAPGVMPARIALLGTGTVGRAVLARLADWAGTPLGARLSLVHAANSRFAVEAEHGLCPRVTQSLAMAPVLGSAPVGEEVGVRVRRNIDGQSSDIGTERTIQFASAASPNSHLSQLLSKPGHLLPPGEGQSARASDLASVAESLGLGATRIVIDATASEVVAARHAAWLAQGIHVVTACKLGQGTSLARWRAIQLGCVHGGTCYGDSATVGAGLPLIRSIRALQAGGDRIHAIAGVLSGSLAWLFNHYDGLRPFSGFVRAARAAGYTEPDPREDLSGEDVRRKILILARSAGVELDSDAVAVESLVPEALARFARSDVDAALPQLDAPLRERFATVRKNGEVMRFIARLEDGKARVGLESLPVEHPLAGGVGTDNRVAIWSDRYCDQPLVIQGPGAGAAVTAAALLDDVLRIAHAYSQTADFAGRTAA